MRLLDVALGHLLGDHVAVNLDILLEGPVDSPPLAGNLQRADRGLRIDQRVDAAVDVGESELVRRLCILSAACGCAGCRDTHLTNGLLVGHVVGGLCGRITRVELVGDEGGAEGLDHEIVVVEGDDDLLLADAGRQRGGDAGGGHVDVCEWKCLVAGRDGRWRWSGGLEGHGRRRRRRRHLYRLAGSGGRAEGEQSRSAELTGPKVWC